MQTITFTCETITPMFLSGADGTKPELRAPSIKGALRFWWRAMNGHLGLTDMKKIEGEIFGDTSQRSKVIIREPQEIDGVSTHLIYDGGSEAFMLPHKPAPQYRNDRDLRSSAKCFPIGSQFQIQIGLLADINVGLSPNNNYIFNFENLQNLFKLTCILGGFGKRNRRGFGSVKIIKSKVQDEEWQSYEMPKTLQEVFNLLPTAYFENNNNTISQRFRRPTNNRNFSEYPYIKTIELGTMDNDLTKKIINDSHLVKEQDHLQAKNKAESKADYFEDRKTNERKLNIKKYVNFDNAIGNGGRFASPIYVSTIETNERLKSIITTLNSVPNGRFDEQTHGALQTEYKNKLKNINNAR